ncbi:uncharacterized protein TNCV_2817451 [Trichonephila clavipes]|nr:uncharacterized protein TNCV_2817451 [Trichonephila clavipes]
MHRVRSSNAYQHVSDFYKDRIIAYRDCGLPYRKIAARVGQDPMTVSRIWNRWVQDVNMMNPGSVYSIKSVASVFCGIVVNAHWQRACIRYRHTGPSPGMMVWDAIGYASRSPLVSIGGTLNSARYISGVLRPVALTFIRVPRNSTFEQDNALPHVVGIVQTFLDTENVRLLPWPARSADLWPIENV